MLQWFTLREDPSLIYIDNDNDNIEETEEEKEEREKKE